MADHSIPQASRFGQCISIACIGAGIGWLVGHSASPVIAGVIASLMGLVGGVVTGLRSISQESRESNPLYWSVLDARPAAIIVLAIAIGATGAMVVKSHRWLEPAVLREAAMRAAAEGRREDIPDATALLYRVSQHECNALLSLRGNDRAFVGELQASSLPGAQQLVNRISDTQTLITIVEALCEKH